MDRKKFLNDKSPSPKKLKGAAMSIQLEKAFSALAEQLLFTCGIVAPNQALVSNEVESAMVAQECLAALLGRKTAANLRIYYHVTGAPYVDLAEVEGNSMEVRYPNNTQQLLISMTTAAGLTASLAVQPESHVRLLGAGIDMVSLDDTEGIASTSLKRLNQYFSSTEVEFLLSQEENGLVVATAQIIAAKEAVFKSMGELSVQSIMQRCMMSLPTSFMDMEITDFDFPCLHARVRERKCLKQRNLGTELQKAYDLVLQTKRVDSLILAVAFCLGV